MYPNNDRFSSSLVVVVVVDVTDHLISVRGRDEVRNCRVPQIQARLSGTDGNPPAFARVLRGRPVSLQPQKKTQVTNREHSAC